MFERFTDRARDVVVLAQDEARTRKHECIDTGHLLLALMRQGQGLGLEVLDSLGVSREVVTQQADRAVGTGQHPDPSQIPFADGAVEALRLAYRESIDLGQGYVGTGHILLGLLREGNGTAAKVLTGLGADLERCRQLVTGIAGSPSQEKAARGRVRRSLRAGRGHQRAG
jgi:ATP-dependent Clp protease ATP-binding subunit ClpC